jgi:CHAT domain-containing protein
LMNRFYQDLLGKREGLNKPMSKAEALHEAKSLLRNLSFDEALRLTASLSGGVSRGDRGTGAKLNLVVPSGSKTTDSAKDDKPFASPRYWAAFILIGDPN